MVLEAGMSEVRAPADPVSSEGQLPGLLSSCVASQEARSRGGLALWVSDNDTNPSPVTWWGINIQSVAASAC